MKSPHFFKAKSRLGLINKPVRQSELNIGVEDAPDAILTSNFLVNYPNSKVNEFIFPKPEEIKKENYLSVLASSMEEFKNLINHNLKENETQVVIGGDNGITFPSLLAVYERINDPSLIGYIQFDSHGEMNSWNGSDSHNFHGMYMRPFFDTFDKPEIDKFIPQKFTSDQALLIGDLVLDGDEPEFFIEKKFRNITREEYLSSTSAVRNEVKRFVESFNHLHVNFDVDVFHQSVSKATGIAQDGKWMKDEVFDLLKVVSKRQNISIDLVEVNPKREGAEKTIALAQNVLKTVLL